MKIKDICVGMKLRLIKNDCGVDWPIGSIITVTEQCGGNLFVASFSNVSRIVNSTQVRRPITLRKRQTRAANKRSTARKPRPKSRKPRLRAA